MKEELKEFYDKVFIDKSVANAGYEIHSNNMDYLLSLNTIKLFHISPLSNMISILESGLKRNKSPDGVNGASMGVIYFSNKPVELLDDAEASSVIFEVVLATDMILVDGESYFNTKVSSLDLSENNQLISCVVLYDIPPSKLKLVKIIN